MVVQYLVNRNNDQLYKAVNNKILLMWYRSRKDWGKCTTTYQDLYIGNYIDNFDLIDERSVNRYK